MAVMAPFREAPEGVAGHGLATADGVGTDLFQCDLRKEDVRTSVGQTLGVIHVKTFSSLWFVC